MRANFASWAEWWHDAAHMAADPRRFELDELVNRPGTYFNPQTEILIVVDDSPEIDGEIFDMEEYEGADWVLVADEVPVEERRRDELLESFQALHSAEGRVADPDDEEDVEEDLHPDEERDDE